MKKFCTLACAALTAATLTAAPRAGLQASQWEGNSPFATFMTDGRQRHTLPMASNLVNNPFEAMRAAKAHRVIEPAASTGPDSYFCTLLGPDGSSWYAVGNMTSTDGSITHFAVTVYDSEFKKLGVIEDDVTFDAEAGETRVVAVSLVPQVTQKFFNYNANYEVMVYVAKNRVDYTIADQTLVYELGGVAPIATFDGNCISALNAAADAWSETFYLTFMSGDYRFDIYEKAGYGSGPKLIGQIDVPSELISGDEARPFLATVHNGVPYFCTSHLEKPFYEDPADYYNENLTPDNNLIVDLYSYEGGYSKTFAKKCTTTIPTPNPATMSDPFGMYYVGNFLYDGDVTFGVYDSSETAPCYILTVSHYVPSSDTYYYDYRVVDADGQTIDTIGEGVQSGVFLQDLPGEEPQVLLIKYDSAAEAYFFDVVEYTTCTPVVTIPQIVDGEALSASFDRVPSGDSYLYISSKNFADSDADGNAIHSIIYLNIDGSINHIDRINLGQNVALAMPYLKGSFVNPYVFNTDQAQEYIFLIKRFTGQSSTTAEEASVINNLSETLVTFNSDSEKGALNYVIFTTGAAGRNMWIAWMKDWQYSTEFFNLPLVAFSEGGDGSADNPYVIATMGDLQQVSRHPEAHYRVSADIDAAGFQLASIETLTGSIDGGGHVISNLVVNGQGIFESITEGASITDLWFSNVTLEADDYGNAALLTSFAVGAYFEGIHVSGLQAVVPESVQGTVGSLVGSLVLGSKMTGCSVSGANLDCPRSSVGGLVASTSTGAEITACSFSGKINGGYDVGGIAGSISNSDDDISNCHVTADITACSTVGGIAGSSSRGTVSNCIVEGTIAANGPARSRYNDAGPCAGGVIGRLEADWTQNEATTPDPIVYNNVVALTSLTGFESEAEPSWTTQRTTLHRIVGYTADNAEPDPTRPVVAEQALAANYATTAAATDTETGANTVEGATATLAELDTARFVELGYAFGDDTTAPWVAGNPLPALWFERGAIVFANDIWTVSVDQEVVVEVKLLGASGLTDDNLDGLEYTLDNPSFEVTAVAASGDTVEITVMAIDEGSTTLTVSWHGMTAQTTIEATPVGIENIEADGAGESGGIVRYYDLQGRPVANPATGVYIRIDGNRASKVMIKE